MDDRYLMFRNRPELGDLSIFGGHDYTRGPKDPHKSKEISKRRKKNKNRKTHRK